jgi:hypothetical protein
VGSGEKPGKPELKAKTGSLFVKGIQSIHVFMLFMLFEGKLFAHP